MTSRQTLISRLLRNHGGMRPTLTREMTKDRGHALDTNALSLLHWHHMEETRLVSLGALPAGQRTIFYEGVI